MAVEAVAEIDAGEAEAPAKLFEQGYTWTLLMRSQFSPAVAVVPGFPTREAAQRAGAIAEGNPNVDEFGVMKDVEVVSSAGAWTRRWADIAILPVPKG